MQFQLTNPDDKLMIQDIVVPDVNEWEALFANAGTSLESGFADCITLMDGLE